MGHLIFEKNIGMCLSGCCVNVYEDSANLMRKKEVVIEGKTGEMG